jgi:hypothetical protein
LIKSGIVPSTDRDGAYHVLNVTLIIRFPFLCTDIQCQIKFIKFALNQQKKNKTKIFVGGLPAETSKKGVKRPLENSINNKNC